MERFEDLFEVFSGLTQALLKQSDTAAEVIEHVTFAAKLLVAGADFVSVTLRDEKGNYFTPVATSDVCAELDQVQYRYGEGPCVECAREPGPGFAYSARLSTDDRWPRFGPVAARLGVQSLLAVTLTPDRRSVSPPGALNVYSTQPDGLSEDDRYQVLILAAHAALALAHTSAVTYHQLRERQLQQALASRDVIGQAKGILMYRQGISASDAFDLLKRTSQDMNIKLIEIAKTITSRRSDT
ncbi:ANTAR domain-containing protein [Hoyosella sp. YIM 151337]|uniref:GAF and ANTAR domain-containing protein n=1 Tax=Hoyosella sp. YIM 151337 TaxID=2992742 RepID=UPI002235B08F|nr:ANTAR domain-containing protein [Hoyosella sp. YIM 151337]MCW4354106.1 ANTAR domain-containing protein [Hoyosella sp. YIM 151337]